MKLGIGSYTFMWSIGFPGVAPRPAMDASGLLDRAHAAGVEVVQYGPNLPLSGLSDAALDRLLGRARDCRIEIEIGIRGVAAPDVHEAIGLARRVCAPLLRCTVERAAGIALTPAELERGLREIRTAIEDANLLLALENSLLPARCMASVLESVGSPALGVALDTVNSLAVPEGTVEVATALAPWVHCLHIKDFSVHRVWHAMGFVVEGRAAGQGQLNLPELLCTLHAAGASPQSAILELWPPEQRSLEETIALEHRWADDSLQYLRPFFHRAENSAATAAADAAGGAGAARCNPPQAGLPNRKGPTL